MKPPTHRYQDQTKILPKKKIKVHITKYFLKSKIIASTPTISWQIEGENVELMTDFLFWGSKITADGDWSHEIRRQLLLGRKAVTNLDSVLKSRDITLRTKVCIVKATPVVQSWTIKKVEC